MLKLQLFYPLLTQDKSTSIEGAEINFPLKPDVIGTCAREQLWGTWAWFLNTDQSGQLIQSHLLFSQESHLIQYQTVYKYAYRLWESNRDKRSWVLWFKPSQQLSTTQLLTHSPHPPSGMGERIKKIKKVKLMGWDSSLIGQKGRK